MSEVKLSDVLKTNNFDDKDVFVDQERGFGDSRNYVTVLVLTTNHERRQFYDSFSTL